MENVETKSNTAPVTPTPAQPQTTSAAPVVAAAPATPAVVVDKSTQAFIKLRQEKSRLKQELAAERAAHPVAPVAPTQPQGEAAVQPQAQVAPAVPVTRTEDSVVEERADIEALANDPDVMKIPGGIVDILDAIDASPRLSKLYAIDRPIALREAKSLWAQKLGIAPAPIVPMTTATSGGMGGGNVNNDLDAIYAQIQANRPGTAKYKQLVKQYNEARARQ